jgi:hypothetical protein
MQKHKLKLKYNYFIINDSSSKTTSSTYPHAGFIGTDTSHILFLEEDKSEGDNKNNPSISVYSSSKELPKIEYKNKKYCGQDRDSQNPKTAVMTTNIIIVIFLLRLVTKPGFISLCSPVAVSDHHQVFILAARLKHYSLAFQTRGPSSILNKPCEIRGGQSGIGNSSPSNSGFPC